LPIQIRSLFLLIHFTVDEPLFNPLSEKMSDPVSQSIIEYPPAFAPTAKYFLSKDNSNPLI